jgi:hypothetical protein
MSRVVWSNEYWLDEHGDHKVDVSKINCDQDGLIRFFSRNEQGGWDRVFRWAFRIDYFEKITGTRDLKDRQACARFLGNFDEAFKNSERVEKRRGNHAGQE